MNDVEKLYIGAIKNLLAVRVTTSSDLCLVELEYPPLSDINSKNSSAG